MHEEPTPEGATGSGSQKPGSGNKQLALTEENAEEGGKLLEEFPEGVRFGIADRHVRRVGDTA